MAWATEQAGESHKGSLLGHHFLFKHPGTDQELSPKRWASGIGGNGRQCTERRKGHPHSDGAGQKEANPIREGKSSWHCDLKEHQGFKGALGGAWVSKP